MHHYARFLQIGSHIRMYPTVILVFHGKYYKSDIQICMVYWLEYCGVLKQFEKKFSTVVVCSHGIGLVCV